MPTENLESTGTTLDGTPILLRPIRPEDEAVLQDLFAHMSRNDVRLRFFAPMRKLSHALAARLSHLDYGREMALVAQHGGMTLCVARYSADPDRRSAEFAVAVRSDWHGRGVGQLLMAEAKNHHDAVTAMRRCWSLRRVNPHLSSLSAARSRWLARLPPRPSP